MASIRICEPTSWFAREKEVGSQIRVDANSNGTLLSAPNNAVVWVDGWTSFDRDDHARAGYPHHWPAPTWARPLLSCEALRQPLRQPWPRRRPQADRWPSRTRRAL
ncbi:MAG: hypothetical protein EOO40_05660 [Deltaproteobacteria bacterium]|nr:MAG: hypothetical protein EOO40_05660 [Deltaproteobacteria bacterium]